MISFDYSINLGQLVTFLGFVIGGLGVVFSLRYDVRSLGSRLLSVEEELKKMTDVMVALARQDEQFKSVNRRLDSLEKRP